MRYQFIDTEKKVFPISLLCKVMNVSRSGFYSWSCRDKSDREKERERLIPKVKKIHKEVRGAYGARRISEELTAKGENCGRTKAATLMQLANVAAQPDVAYCSDITYIWTTEGWLYLAVVIDLYSRKIVGWSLKSRMTKDLVINALQMAIWRRRPLPGLIFHSDRGSQYCSNDFQRFLKENRMTSSMSRR